MRLILVRHGETPANVVGSLDTTLPGPGLTDLGREQAARLPDALRPHPIDSLWVSGAVRTHETCRPLAESLGMVPTELPGAHEIQAGELEKRTDPESVHLYLQTLASWVEGDLDAHVPGGESGREAIDRFTDSVRRIEESGSGTAVLVSHGAMIRLWTYVSSPNLRGAVEHREPLPNTGIVVLEGGIAEGWQTVSWLDRALAVAGPRDEDPYDGPTGHPFEDA